MATLLLLHSQPAAAGTRCVWQAATGDRAPMTRLRAKQVTGEMKAVQVLVSCGASTYRCLLVVAIVRLQNVR